MSEVSVSRFEHRMVLVSPHVGLTEGKDVVALSEWIRVVVDGLKDDLRVFGGSLASGRPIVGPLRNVFHRGNGLVDDSGLSSHVEASVVNPDVFNTGLGSLGPVFNGLVVFSESWEHRVEDN